MSGRRTALLERFRAKTRERLAGLAAVVADAAAPSAEAWRDALGSLHTIKGEARMLGLAAIAELAHAIEERLFARTDGWPPLGAAGVGVALEALAALIGDELIDSDRARARAADGAAALHGASAPSSSSSSHPPIAVATPATAARFVHVRAAQIDAICDGLEELRAMLGAIGASREAAPLRDRVEAARTRFDQLAEQAWALRLAPIEPVLTELAAHARELATEGGKRLDVVVDAGRAELERTVLDALAEPLLHLVRNAIDHGLERPDARGAKPAVGRLVLAAAPRLGGVVLDVEDDGRGLDVAQIRDAAVRTGVLDHAAAAALADDDVLDLVFQPRLSTRLEASPVSGRGLGLDVVRRVVESLGGAVTVAARPGGGTRFSISVPIGVSRERVLVVPIGGLLLGIPARQVAALVTIGDDAVEVSGGRALRLGDALIPLRSLAAAIGVGASSSTSSSEAEPLAVVVEIGDRRWAFAVGAVLAEVDVLRRPADRGLAAFGFIGASAVLDDGRAVLLPALAEVLRRHGGRGAPSRAIAAVATTTSRRRALVVDDSQVVRELLAELMASIGLAVATAGDGHEALASLAESFDVIVTDVEMPRMDGLELLRQIRARGIRTPVVVVTTRGAADDRRRAVELGADAYVVKTDFREAQLVEIVRRLIEVPR